MSKLKWIFCISLVSVCLLAACGAVRNRIVLPDAGDRKSTRLNSSH